MATDIRALPSYFNTDADFRNWIDGLRAQFTACGLVQTADTGQVNSATVTKPAAINTFQGYDIWRFADALQATKPVFIKIEYGSAGATDRPSLAFTVGTGTNGAGTLTGQVGTRTVERPNTSKAAGGTLNSYCSGSTSRLSLVTNLDSANSSFFMAALIERPRNSAGVEQGDCVATLFSSTGVGAAYQAIPFAGSVPGQVAYAPCAPPAAGAVSAVGADVALGPSMIFCGKVLFGSFLSYLHADIGELASFNANHLGGAHVFMPMGDGYGSSYSNYAQASNHSLAILWE